MSNYSEPQGPDRTFHLEKHHLKVESGNVKKKRFLTEPDSQSERMSHLGMMLKKSIQANCLFEEGDNRKSKERAVLEICCAVGNYRLPQSQNLVLLITHSSKLERCRGLVWLQWRSEEEFEQLPGSIILNTALYTRGVKIQSAHSLTLSWYEYKQQWCKSLRLNCDAVFLAPYRYDCNLQTAVICLPFNLAIFLTMYRKKNTTVPKLALIVKFSATPSLK